MVSGRNGPVSKGTPIGAIAGGLRSVAETEEGVLVVDSHAEILEELVTDVPIDPKTGGCAHAFQHFAETHLGVVKR